MRKVIYSMMVSLDGFIENPNREINWILIDEELHTFINNQQAEIDTYLYGRRLYEVMTYWETADTNPGDVSCSKTRTAPSPSSRLVWL